MHVVFVYNKICFTLESFDILSDSTERLQCLKNGSHVGVFVEIICIEKRATWNTKLPTS